MLGKGNPLSHLAVTALPEGEPPDTYTFLPQSGEGGIRARDEIPARMTDEAVPRTFPAQPLPLFRKICYNYIGILSRHVARFEEDYYNEALGRTLF